MTTPNASVAVGKLNHSRSTGENVKWQSHSGKQLDSFLKNKTEQLP